MQHNFVDDTLHHAFRKISDDLDVFATTSYIACCIKCGFHELEDYITYQRGFIFITADSLIDFETYNEISIQHYMPPEKVYRIIDILKQFCTVTNEHFHITVKPCRSKELWKILKQYVYTSIIISFWVHIANRPFSTGFFSGLTDMSRCGFV